MPFQIVWHPTGLPDVPGRIWEEALIADREARVENACRATPEPFSVIEVHPALNRRAINCATYPS